MSCKKNFSVFLRVFCRDSASIADEEFGFTTTKDVSDVTKEY